MNYKDILSPDRAIVHGFAFFGATAILWLVSTATGILFKVTLILGIGAIGWGSYKMIREYMEKREQSLAT